ncbi:MAG: rRNA maturation RNase YbeY [Bacteroidales bacterium]|jgi:rRNA maturation RNase YbeY|nr:rRNA maturation RNase YbeY [Bacteroidales bacterium]
MGTISFFASSTKIPSFKRRELKKNVEKIILAKKRIVGNISYIFCTDEELLSINKKYLNHDTYTDIITFDYSGGADIALDEDMSKNGSEYVSENAGKSVDKNGSNYAGKNAGRNMAKMVNFGSNAGKSADKNGSNYAGKNAGRNMAKMVNFDSSGSVVGVYGVPSVISGDIFISVERVCENATKYGVPFKMELLRVMIHGILHLLGLKDKTPVEEKNMRAAEDDAIRRFF